MESADQDMPHQAPFDLLIVDEDIGSATCCAGQLRQQGAVRTLVHASAREAIAAFSRTRLDAIVCTPRLADTDCWRFIRMVRSGRFGFSATPCFVLCDQDEIAALAPMTDEYTTLLDAHGQSDLLARITAHCAGQRTDSVLIVEDEPHAAQVAARALEKYYTVEIAPDAASALAAWHRSRHALVILDLGLPDMPGARVLEHLLAENPDQSVIILTAQDAPEAHQELMLSGAMQYLAKPIDLHHLADTCTRVLRERACLAQAERLRLSADAQREVSGHLHAANFRLEHGQTASASAHLRHALAAARCAAPSDDQWIELMDEFDAR
jgi:DNA-binding response OmpR family regulator